MELCIFAEHEKHPVWNNSSPVEYPQDINDLRNLASRANEIASLIMPPRVLKMLTNVATQHICDGSYISWEADNRVSHITISKTAAGIEVVGPEVLVFKRFYDGAIASSEPVCIEVIMSNMLDVKDAFGEYVSHSALLVIYNTGRIYLIDPNYRSAIADYKSDALEVAIVKLLPHDPRFTFVPQHSWLTRRKISINSSYDHLGISSGWCRTITTAVAGAIMRAENQIHPTKILGHLADMSDTLRIMMFKEVARMIVINSYSPKECTKLLEKLKKMRDHKPTVAPDNDRPEEINELIDPSEFELQQLLSDMLVTAA